MPLCRYFNIFIFSKKKVWFIILKKLLNEKQYHIYNQSCIKQKDWSNKSVLISWIIVKFVYRASMPIVIIWLHSLLWWIHILIRWWWWLWLWLWFYPTKLMFYISEMTNTDHMWHQRTGCIKHRKLKVLLSCLWSI